jgi:dienelactone hydrolase
MAIITRPVAYRDGDTTLEGYLACDDEWTEPRPGILIAHTWAGRGEGEEKKARQLAEAGYAGFALDLYGRGVRGRGAVENRRLMQPFIEDRALLQRRMQLAVDEVRALDEVDCDRVAAIGYCFGGLCVLDLARSAADIRAAVSFHGLLTPPGNTAGNRIKASVLVLHGWDDPMAKPEALTALGHELSDMGADWQIHAYGNAMHAFTNPAADSADFGTVYQADADRRSWQAMHAFLAERLS